jgi:hypothetical protein
MLGYKSPCGGKNFKFAEADRAEIVAWIRTILRVAWNDAPDLSIADEERSLGEEFRPILNIKDNPLPCGELKRLRELSRAGLKNRT